MITSIIFDMDGVLIDSQPMHYEADQITLKHFGVAADMKLLESFAGTTNPDRYARFKELFHMPYSIDEMVDFRENVIMDYVHGHDLTGIRGVDRLLADIRAAGLKTAVASSSSYAYIYAVLDKLGFREYFDKVVSGDDMENGKPAPDIFLKAALELESCPEECVVIEDSGNGVLAANRAAMKVVGFINPSSGEQDLSTATLIIDAFDKIDADRLAKI